ncbi:Type II secretion system protein GspG [Sulfidibacter corallicola]|uniref:Type II secretion system protein GspG n=1 Tax=Sulfidibacter corallicola TaxID=2818388 RepID=A0A8A4TVM9_SULCO|nr:type II secretion system protein GspG [Sulfidibacter corallicola]QTD53184.1 type II secretion system protein GspG [Sulfidibacter corallicola]
MKLLFRVGLLMCALISLGCKDEDTEKAKKLYDRADLYAERREFRQAIEILQRIQIDYSETSYAKKAENEIEELQRVQNMLIDNERDSIHSNFQRIHRALEHYKVRFLAYPLTPEDLKKLPPVVTPEWEDPWGNPIHYKPTYSSARIPKRAPDGYVLATFGKDGLPGGVGQDQDRYFSNNKEVDNILDGK